MAGVTKAERHLLIVQLSNRMALCANTEQLQEAYREAMLEQLYFMNDAHLQELNRDIPQVHADDKS